jgi:predicted Rossmann fold nucleotide-binding protein DprA/Smf involved in DNA uptake
MKIETFKVVIAGSRGFNDYNLLKKKLDLILNDISIPIEIVSGGARGADKLGERYAKEKRYLIKRFIPDWNIGKHAGLIRNEEMAKYADACICFYDGESNGTGHMIKMAKKYNLKLRVINYG